MTRKKCIIQDCDKKSVDKTTHKCIEHGGGKRCPNCID